MKNAVYVDCFLTLMANGITASAQMYQSANDTVKLNTEFTEVSNDIADSARAINSYANFYQ